MKSHLLGGRHATRRDHTVKVFHEKDPEGSAVLLNVHTFTSWREEETMRLQELSGEDGPPPF
jgi:hypothetical protein